MKEQKQMALWLVALLATVMSLCACQKTTKTSSAGGGSSSQSVMTIKGATR